jgi:hypothetical protein
LSLYSFEEICEKCENAVWHDCPDCYSKHKFCHCEIHAEEQASAIHGECTSFKSKKVDQQEIGRNNMKYLELNAEQYKIHKKLMTINMNLWPKPLKKYLSEKHGKDMFCGDALMCWVADWIRSNKKTYLI